MRSAWLFVAGCSAAIACSSAEDSGSSGSGGSAGQGACWDVATSCPTLPPYVGGHCELTDACSYAGSPYEYQCQSGRWSAVCMANRDGQMCIPPFGEACDSPSSKPISGVTLEIAAGDATQPFTPLADGAPVDVVWGGQGSPMLAYRVRVSGAPVPDCALVAHKLALGPYSGAETKTPVRLHCGESLVVYDIVPIDQGCSSPPLPQDLGLEVSAFGQKKTLKLTWPNAACPKGGGFG